MNKLSESKVGEYDNPFTKRIFDLTKMTATLFQFIPFLLIPFLTLGFDEAWVIGATANIAIDGSFCMGETIGSNSTGGLYTIIQVLLTYLFGKNLIIARALSAFSLILLLREVKLFTACMFEAPSFKWLTTAFILGAPSIYLYSSLAYSVILATWLLLRGVRIWSFSELSYSHSRVV
jgi:hypothetical protein